jgi:hypothetical protein
MASTKEPVDGKSAVAASINDARRKLARRKKFEDPLPHIERDGALPGRWTADALGMPKESPCPVVPLGREGELYHMMDSAGQFRSFCASDFSHAGIQDLFARAPHWPKWAAPRYGRAPAPKDGEAPKPPPIKSFEDDKIREMLMKACSDVGQFSADNKLRGRGAWLLRGGGLIYHAGEELWRCELRDGVAFWRCSETGMVENHLYPLLPEIPPPWDQPMSRGDNPAGVLLETFRCWNFEKPAIDPILLLGWIGAAFLGGALDWRPAIVLVGDKGTGKSTLQDGLKNLFGDALFHSADTTAAGIYQKMAHDARPVAVDELEAGADNRKVDAVVRLMRAASSGALASRGGQDHHGVEFQMRSAFLFSAINNPLQSSQDLSRVAILRLRPLDKDKRSPAPIDVDTAGRKILARLMAEWHRFGELYEQYAAALSAGGHDARGQKTYGVLLACADMMLGPELAEELGVPLTEDLAYWTENLAADRLPEVEDAAPNWRACLTWLLTAQVQQWRSGARTTVGKLLADLASFNAPDGFDINAARNELALTGLGLLAPGELLPSVPRDAGHILCVPNSSPLVGKLFEGTQWGGSPGAGGPWKDALRQAPETIAISHKDKNRISIAGVQQRCTLIVLKNFHEAPER